MVVGGGGVGDWNQRLYYGDDALSTKPVSVILILALLIPASRD